MDNEHLGHDGPNGPADAELEAVLYSLDDADLNPTPPPGGLWDRVAAQIADDPSGAATPTLVDVNSRGAVAPTAPGAARRRTWPGWAAAAAIVMVVAGVATWFATRPSDRVVATAQLQHEVDFDSVGAGAAASAELIERDGMYLISLHDTDLPSELGEDADLELWLIEAEADGSLDVQPVGLIDQGDGTYGVPDGLNPATHNIVDISIEPRDGDATHSGRSILRGTLVET